jgi:23S rRNA maturation-related 3'-5' exoribonuclease YhaM
MKKTKERFIKLLRSTERRGIEEVINYLEESGFFIAPASTNHHLNCECGLMMHSLNVYDMAMALRETIVARKPEVAEKIPEKSIIIAALLHDTCKANIYKKAQRWKKDNQGNWELNDTYETDYSRLPVGHGEKSVISC